MACRGMAYVIMATGVPGGALSIGLIAGGLKGLAVGLLIGAAIAGANCLLFDWLIDSAMVRLQPAAQHTSTRILFNIAGFSWAIGLCILSMGATLAAILRLQPPGV